MANKAGAGSVSQAEFLLVPSVNGKISREARSHTKSRDIKYQQTQGLLVKTVIPLIEMMDTLMKAVVTKQEIDPH